MGIRPPIRWVETNFESLRDSSHPKGMRRLKTSSFLSNEKGKELAPCLTPKGLNMDYHGSYPWMSRKSMSSYPLTNLP